MLRTLLKSKLHRVRVTDCHLHYEGSCAIDQDLLEAAKLVEYEQLHVWNINNGERFVTYAITAPRGSGTVSLNGSAARRACVGDHLILASFAQVGEEEIAKFHPQLVFVDEHNRMTHQRTQSNDPPAPVRS
jgi:aspartate 1-decarboxylase